MKKFSPLVALIALAAAVAVGVVVGRNWPSAAHGEADKTAAATPGKTDYAAAASQLRAPVDTVAIPDGGFDPQQVQVAQVTQQNLPVELDTPGKLAYNAERTKLASARVAGRLDRILVFEGALVHEGQPLAELYAPDYISAQKEYLLALNTARTLQGSTMKDLQDDAQQTAQSAAGRLH
ncbi:efflux RND transporter periplasmic adaptor subunit, partial [Ralstonia solanacearum]